MADIKQAKYEAKRWLKQHPRWLLPASLRAIFTVASIYILWLFAHSYAFDQRLKDYHAQTTDVKDFIFVCVVCLIGRWLCDKWLYHVLYETKEVPLSLIVANTLRVSIYTFATVFGTWFAVYLNTPIVLQVFWFVWTPIIWLWSRQLGSQVMAVYQLSHQWRTAFQTPPIKGFVKAFFWHELLNVFTFGVYTIWLVPYKRKTIQIQQERSRKT